jgi:hypothetical protein
MGWEVMAGPTEKLAAEAEVADIEIEEGVLKIGLRGEENSIKINFGGIMPRHIKAE